MRNLLVAALVIAFVPALAQSPIPNDPFLSVPPPTSRPRPIEPAPRPAQPQQQTTPQPQGSGYPVAVGQSFRDCFDCPEMMVIPAGRFVMGSPASEAERDHAEGPQREVVVSRPLAVGRFEVTIAEWDACFAAGGCAHQPSDEGWGRGNRPVINVSWDDAQAYVRWLSQRTGRGYRLLTEAEWEYAARAGTTTPYSFGRMISPSQANFGNKLGRTTALASYAPNRFGLYDIHGNVWEWVEDCWTGSYAGAPSDAGQAVRTGDCSARVLRGGSLFSSPQNLRVAIRSWYSPRVRGNDLGFRLARTPSG
jgi:formylglycine-generating enzyme required for sulfatase activity